MAQRGLGLVFVLVGIGSFVYFHQSDDIMAAVMGAIFVGVGLFVALRKDR